MTIERDEEVKRRVSSVMKGTAFPADLRAPLPSEPATRTKKPLGPYNVANPLQKDEDSKRRMSLVQREPSSKSVKSTSERSLIEEDQDTKRRSKSIRMFPVEPRPNLMPPMQLVAPPSPLEPSIDKKPSPLPSPSTHVEIPHKLGSSDKASPLSTNESPIAPSAANIILPNPSSGGSRESITVPFPKARTATPPQSPLTSNLSRENSPVILGPPSLKGGRQSSLPVFPCATDLDHQPRLGDRKHRMSLPPQAAFNQSPHRQLGERKQRVSLPPSSSVASQKQRLANGTPQTGKHRLGERKQRVSLPPSYSTTSTSTTTTKHSLGAKKQRVSLPPSSSTINEAAVESQSSINTVADSVEDVKQRLGGGRQRRSMPPSLPASSINVVDPPQRLKLGERKSNRVSLPTGASMTALLEQRQLSASSFDSLELADLEATNASVERKSPRSSFSEQGQASVGAFFVPADAVTTDDMEERASFRRSNSSFSSLQGSLRGMGLRTSPRQPSVSSVSSRPGSSRELQQHGNHASFNAPVADVSIELGEFSPRKDDLECGDPSATEETTEDTVSRYTRDVSAAMSVRPGSLRHHSSIARQLENDDADEEEPKKRCMRCDAPWWCNIVMPLVLIIFIALLAIFVVKGIKKGAAETEASQASPVENHALLLFENETAAPNFTLAALEDPGSAQSKAKQWLLADPNAASYSQGRKLQRFALATLYYAAGGARWKDSSGWLEYDVHECTWFSAKVEVTEPSNTGEPSTIPAEKLIICNHDLEYEYLLLASDSLRGTLPPEISLLTSLKKISLESNKLFGSIPTEFGLMTSLERIGLSLNELEGNVPTELGRLSNTLQRLYLTDNNLNGLVPTELSKLSGLTDLHLTNNGLTSTIPTELSKLDQLQGLLLNGNQFTATIPSLFGLLTNLRRLDVGRNKLTGIIPTEIGFLSQLKLLGIAKNSLDTTIPTEMAWLSNLDTFLATSSGLHGSIPRHISYLTSLETLALGANSLAKDVPPQLGRLTNLKVLHLYDNRFTGQLPTQLGDLIRLNTFHAFVNQLTSTIPSEFGQLTSLLDLQLFDNTIYGELPTEFGNLSNLQKLHIGGTELSGILPDPTCALVASQQLTIDADCSQIVCC